MRAVHKISSFLQRYPFIVFPIFFCITYFMYYGAHDIILTDDAFEFFLEFQDQGMQGYCQNFGFPSLYYVTHFINILLFKIIGTNTFYWLVIMIFLHAMNSFLSFVLFRLFYLKQQIENGFNIAIIASLLFLISPLHSENILWAATLHYSVSMFFFLAIGIYIMNLKKELGFQDLFLLSVFYILSLLTMEYALVFPFCWYLLKEGLQLDFKKVMHKKLWFGFLILIPLYFIATKLIKGHFLPHYSVEHLQNHGLIQYAKQYLNYFSKHILFTHFSKNPFGYYQKINELFVLSIIWILLTICAYTYYKKNRGKGMVLMLLFLLSFIMLMPVINMYFMIVHQYENNRLGYYFSLIVFQLLVFLLFELRPRFRYLFISTYILISFYFLRIIISDATIAGKIYSNCIQTFPAMGKDTFYLLNLPNNYKGFYLFRNLRRFNVAMRFFKGEIYNNNEIASTNLLHYNDSFHYKFIGDTILQVGHKNYGDYFMKGSLGATNRKEAHYDFVVDEYSINYEVRFKKPIEQKVPFLLFQHDRFIRIH